MKRTTRLLIATLAVALVGAGLAACSSGGDDTSTARTTTGSTGTGSSPSSEDGSDASDPLDLSGVTLRVGDQVNIQRTSLTIAGELDDVPYEIEWTTFVSGPPLMEALNAEAIDVGSVGDSPPIIAQAAGWDIHAVAVNRTKATDRILVPAGSDITSPADLAGKKVAVARGSSSHHVLIAALADAGLSYDDIEPVDLQPPDAASAFDRGDVDAWAMGSPFADLAVENGAAVIARGPDLTPGLGFIVTNGAVLADPVKEAALADFVGRVVRAQTWGLAHRDQWRDAFVEHTGLPAALVEAIIVGVEPRYEVISATTIAEQQAAADAFARAGVITAGLDVARAIDDRFNDVVADAIASGPG